MSNTFQPDRTNRLSVSKTLSASNTTASVPLFRITGAIHVTRIHGVVTTVIGSNHTGAYFRLNDQTAQINITLDTGGATLSSIPAGSVILKTALNTSIASVKSAAAGYVQEPSSAEVMVDSGFIIGKKSGANTDIEYVYTTTNTPTSGVIQFWLEWINLTDDASVTAQ